jgi:carbamoyl-phosphate synthase large subunit
MTAPDLPGRDPDPSWGGLADLAGRDPMGPPPAGPTGPPPGKTGVLVTGVGGPAAIAVMKSLRHDQCLRLIAADMDPWASGLYLVRPENRTLLPAGDAPDFAEAVLDRCLAMDASIVIPTVDAELGPLAEVRDSLAVAGIELLLAPDEALRLTLDKFALIERCADVVRVPRTELFDGAVDAGSWACPVIIKPREGSGSRDISLVRSARALAAMHRSAAFIIQEFLPGQEYSIDVLADGDGHVISAVPRVREKVDSGVSVAGRTIHDRELEGFGVAVAEAVGLTYIANVQCRRDTCGRPALLEVNPRAPGALPLTVASGVDMPRLALDALRGRPVPSHLGFRDVAMVRFLEERFIETSEVQQGAM